MNGESSNIINEQVEKLRQLFPEAISEGKVDREKLQATLGKENIEFLNERYVLNWAGKSEAFRVLQQAATATLKPVPEESVNFETTENIFIEGENLQVLKILQKSYYGKIKCIIIDPPYNTGNDSFIYPDSFKENMLYELILKAGYLLTDKVVLMKAQGSGHRAQGGFYSVNGGELIIALDEINQKLVDAIIAAKPKKVIMLDNLFTGNDQLKTNTVLQMKEAEIDFKTI
jgi:adenine-specific DNA-methyltransferase